MTCRRSGGKKGKNYSNLHRKKILLADQYISPTAAYPWGLNSPWATSTSVLELGDIAQLFSRLVEIVNKKNMFACSIHPSDERSRHKSPAARNFCLLLLPKFQICNPVQPFLQAPSGLGLLLCDYYHRLYLNFPCAFCHAPVVLWYASPPGGSRQAMHLSASFGLGLLLAASRGPTSLA